MNEPGNPDSLHPHTASQTYPQAAIHPPGTVFPMTVSQILDRVARLLRLQWKPLTGIGAAPVAVVIAVEAVFIAVLFFAGALGKAITPADLQRISWITIPFDLIMAPAVMVLYGLYYGAASYAALQADHGMPVSVAQAYGHAWSKMGRYVWLLFLRGLIVALPFIPLMLVFAVGAAMVPLLGTQHASVLILLIPLGALLFAGALVFSIYWTLRMSLAFCACVHEGLTARQAITRSGFLTHGGKGRIFLVALVVYAVGYAVMLAFYFVGAVIVGAFLISGATDLKSMTLFGDVAVGLVALFGAVTIVLWAALLMAAYSIAFAVLYRDQCVRRDGAPRLPAAGLGFTAGDNSGISAAGGL